MLEKSRWPLSQPNASFLQFSQPHAKSFILFVTSIHQKPILFSPIFSTNFSQFEQLKKITNFLLVQNRFFFLSFGPMKSLLSFSTAQLRKFRGKNWGKQDSWFRGSMSWIDYLKESVLRFLCVHNFRKFVKSQHYKSCLQFCSDFL